jgi:aminoglycoside phosphotransferase (APT) family kinase protein
MSSPAGPAGQSRPKTSTRDRETIVRDLAPWLGRQLDADGAPQIANVTGPSGAGFSSETVLFDAQWRSRGRQFSRALVLRLPPAADAYPLFPSYDLGRQVAAMQLTAKWSSVPVPNVLWYEGDASTIGAPFFIMDQIDGVTAPDVMPYVFDSWLTQASADDQRHVETDAVHMLADIHGIRCPAEETAFLQFDASGASSLARHVNNQRAYYGWMCPDGGQPLIDATFAWLDEHWPDNYGADVVSWGDARLGNILWRNHRAVAALDWEAAAIAPPEVDLGWFIYFHQYFQSLAERHGVPGMPDFLVRHWVLDTYAVRSGYQPQTIEWFLAYAALRQALTSIRVVSRAVAFGERPEPDDPTDLIMDRARLESIVAGTPGSWRKAI